MPLPLIIILSVLGALLLLVILLLLFGNAKIHIVCREKLRVVASICGVRFTLISDKKKEKKKKKSKEPPRCRNPKNILKKELRQKEREAKKAEKKRLRAEKKAKKKKAKRAGVPAEYCPTPNLKENLEMILALLKRLYRETRGKIGIHFRKMYIRVATDDAAKTALLYATILQSATLLLNFVEEKFNHVKRKDGAMEITPDYLASTCQADIDLICSVKIRRALVIALRMLNEYNYEKRRAYRKAALREKKKVQKARQKSKK